MEEVVKQIIGRLKRSKLGFGSRAVRPCSLFAEIGRESFIDYVLQQFDHALSELPGAPSDVSDLSRQQQQELRAFVDRIDRFGDLVRSWSTSRSVSDPCLADIDLRLVFWADRNVPAYCWHGLPSRRDIVRDLRSALKQKIDDYHFERDLMVWAIPILNRELLAQIAPIAQAERPAVDVARLRPQLQTRARRCLGHLRTTFGVDGIGVDDVVDRALFAVMHADDAEYHEHCKNANSVSAWAVDKLKDQIKHQVLSRCRPAVQEHSPLATAAKRTWIEVFHREAP